LEFVAFPKTYDQFQNLIKPDTVVLMKAKIDYRDEELKLMAEKFTAPNELALNHSASDSHHQIFIPRKTDKAILAKLGQMLKAQPGDESVVILIPNGGSPQRMVLPYGVAWNDKLAKDIESLLA
jgi:DNA polymerase-3 subunit alpha